MPFDYGKIQTIAGRVLGDFKQGTINLIVVTPGSGPASNPGPSNKSDPIALEGVAQGVPKQWIIGGLALEGDLQVTTAVKSGSNPKVGDMLDIDGVRYTIVGLPFAPAIGTPVVWKFVARRG